LANHIYKMIDIVGSSPDGVTDAMRKAVAKASKTIHNLDWIELVSVRGHIQNGQIEHFQATVRIGFRLEGQDDEIP
jgi:flavin-binding protein dodecin